MKTHAETFDKKPVFIVGVPRSGTSLMWNILVRLPEFNGVGEVEWNTETSIFKKYIRHMNFFFRPGEWPFWFEYYAGKEEFFERFLIDSCRSFLINAAKARQAKRILEKTPNHLEQLDFIVKVFPDACFVHIYRHPVDVYASMRKRAEITDEGKDPWLKVSAADFTESYKRKLEIMLTSDKNIYNLKYEDLTGNPESEVKKVCQFLETDYHSDCILGETPAKQVGKFPIKSNVPMSNSGDWQGVLTDKVVAEIETVCSGIMQQLGYKKYSEEGGL